MRMLYKLGGKVKIDGHDVSHITVDEGDVEDCLKEGWCKSVAEAVEAGKPKPKKKPKKQSGLSTDKILKAKM